MSFKNISFSRILSLIFFVYIFFSTTIITKNCLVSGLPYLNVETSEDRITIVDYTVENLEGSMRWGSFLTDYLDPETFHNLFGYFDEINFHMEMNFDKGTITGSLTGSHSFESFGWKRGLSFNGEFSGTLDKYNWNYNSWFWEFGSNFSLSLTFRMEQRYTNEQNEESWNIREETFEVIAELEGTSFAGRGGIGSFSVAWEEPGSGPENSRYFRLTCRDRLSSGGCDLPADLPEVIDIDAEIIGPQTIRKSDSSVTFNLETSGLDLDRVNQVNWYFWYYDEDFRDFWWLETFEMTHTSSIFIDQSKISDWGEYASDYGQDVDGERRLLMQVIVEFLAGEDEWLFESEAFNFTYVLKESSGFDLEPINDITVYPTQSNQTWVVLEFTGTQLSDIITFEVLGSPEYLVTNFKYPSARESDGTITNQLNVTLDMTKSSGLTLPSEHTLTVKAKSKKGTEIIETSQEVTINLKPVKWLILHYVAEQTNPLKILQHQDEKNIEDIMNAIDVKKDPRVGYILQIDLERSWNTQYCKDTLGRGGHVLRLFNGKLVEIESKQLNMASPDSLREFVDIALKYFPTEKSHLIFTNHGFGIQGVVFEGTLVSTMETVDSLTPSELELALRNQHFDIITFETCHSALIENAYELKGVTDYIIASQFSMYGTGLFYEDFIPQLLSKPSMNSLEHANSVIDTYNHPLRKASISLIKTAAIENLRGKIHDLSTEIRKGYSETPEEFHREIQKVYKKTTFIGPGGSIDLFDFCDKLKASAQLSTLIKSKAQAILDIRDTVILKNKVENAGNRKVLTYRGLIPVEGEEPPDEIEEPVSSWILDESPKTINGLSIWFWGTGQEGLGYTAQKSDFDSTSFGRNTAWKGFIEDYVKGKSEPKTVVTVDQHDKNLFVRIVDSEGSIVGYYPDSETKNNIVLDYHDVSYFRTSDGTTEIILPAGQADFSIIVDGGSMEEDEETYTLNLKVLSNDETLLEKTADYPISIYSEHSIPIELTDDSITISEISIREIIPEPEPEPESPVQRGIPGFPLESLIAGFSLASLVLWLHKRM